MRFGIMSRQIGALFPSELAPEDAFGHVASFNHAQLALDLFTQGFNPIELGGDLAVWAPRAFDMATIRRLLALKDERGITYTFHLPLWSVEPSSPLQSVRQASTSVLTQAIQASLPLEPEVYVLHATGPLAAEFYRSNLPDGAKSFILRRFRDFARDSIMTILAETGIPSRQIAVETIEFPFDVTLELAEELDLSICLDTGHVLVGFSGPLDVFEALERSLTRLSEIHLHDGSRQGPDGTIGYGRDHQPLGSGQLDVGRLLDTLVQASFGGPLVFELTPEDALASMRVISALRPGVTAS